MFIAIVGALFVLWGFVIMFMALRDPSNNKAQSFAKWGAGFIIAFLGACMLR